MQKLKSWKLESFYDDEKYAVLPADDSVPRAFYPLGRNIWKVCNPLMTADMTAETLTIYQSNFYKTMFR